MVSSGIWQIQKVSPGIGQYPTISNVTGEILLALNKNWNLSLEGRATHNTNQPILETPYSHDICGSKTFYNNGNFSFSGKVCKKESLLSSDLSINALHPKNIEGSATINIGMSF